jgi:phosphoglycerate dehydrogenase-like enzyme
MKLAILDDYQNAALDASDWTSLGSDVETAVFDTHLGFDEARIATTLAPFDILVAMRERTRFPRSLLYRLPNLELLVTTGMRNLAIDMDAARENGVVVCGTGMLAYPAAEHAMALIMDLFKNISSECRLMREGGWQGELTEGLNGKRLGILGLGRLGSRVARFGQALEMDVVAWSQNLTEDRCAEVGVQRVDKDTLLRTADVISVHLVLSERTHKLVGARELALMKPTAYLVNTSRGPIIDEEALVKALTDRTIAGAGLDVFDVEPLPADHPLRGLDNAVLTGHTGYIVKEFYAKAYGEAVENIAAWRNGKAIRVLNAPDPSIC